MTGRFPASPLEGSRVCETPLLYTAKGWGEGYFRNLFSVFNVHRFLPRSYPTPSPVSRTIISYRYTRAHLDTAPTTGRVVILSVAKNLCLSPMGAGTLWRRSNGHGRG